jgi:hypothetical protein
VPRTNTPTPREFPLGEGLVKAVGTCSVPTVPPSPSLSRDLESEYPLRERRRPTVDQWTELPRAAGRGYIEEPAAGDPSSDPRWESGPSAEWRPCLQRCCSGKSRAPAETTAARRNGDPACSYAAARPRPRRDGMACSRCEPPVAYPRWRQRIVAYSRCEQRITAYSRCEQRIMAYLKEGSA